MGVLSLFWEGVMMHHCCRMPASSVRAVTPFLLKCMCVAPRRLSTKAPAQVPPLPTGCSGVALRLTVGASVWAFSPPPPPHRHKNYFFLWGRGRGRARGEHPSGEVMFAAPLAS